MMAHSMHDELPDVSNTNGYPGVHSKGGLGERSPPAPWQPWVADRGRWPRGGRLPHHPDRPVTPFFERFTATNDALIKQCKNKRISYGRPCYLGSPPNLYLYTKCVLLLRFVANNKLNFCDSLAYMPIVPSLSSSWSFVVLLKRYVAFCQIWRFCIQMS